MVKREQRSGARGIYSYSPYIFPFIPHSMGSRLELWREFPNHPTVLSWLKIIVFRAWDASATQRESHPGGAILLPTSALLHARFLTSIIPGFQTKKGQNEWIQTESKMFFGVTLRYCWEGIRFLFAGLLNSSIDYALMFTYVYILFFLQLLV